MPGGDGTGPVGFGPRTGRAMGYCAGYPAPGYANPGFGRGLGFGRGRGGGRGGGRGRGGNFGFGRMAPAAYPRFSPAAPTPEAEMEWLESMVQDLEEELKNIKARIESLKSEE